MNPWMYSVTQASEFFKAWREISITVLEYFGLPTSPGAKTRPWKDGKPVGVTTHYTAGVTWKNTIRHLSGAENKNSSCHALVLDRHVAEVSGLFKGPLEKLQCLSLLLADIDTGTFHAGWVNSKNFGIENRNAGCLMGEQESWRWWPNNWQAKFPHQELGKMPVNLNGTWWEPYTAGQLADNVHICQMLFCLYEGQLDPRWFLPHSATKGTKMDTGRAYPLAAIRDAVFHQREIEDLFWLQKYKADPMYMDGYDDKEEDQFLAQMASRQKDRDEWWDDEDEFEDNVVPSLDVQQLSDNDSYKWREMLGTVRLAYDKLGYCVPHTDSQELDMDTALATYQFQKSMGMATDRVPGPLTQQAIMKRLVDFGLSE